MKSKRTREWEETWNKPSASDDELDDGFGPCSPFDDDTYRPGPDDYEAYEAYEVGYKKPPKKNQFRKGVSGNPSGRTRVTKGSVATRMRELRKRYVITENGRKHSMTAVEVIIRRQIMDAIAGDRYARAEVLAFADRHMPRDKRESRAMKRDPGQDWYRWSPRLDALLEGLEKEFCKDPDPPTDVQLLKPKDGNGPKD